MGKKILRAPHQGPISNFCYTLKVLKAFLGIALPKVLEEEIGEIEHPVTIPLGSKRHCQHRHPLRPPPVASAGDTRSPPSPIAVPKHCVRLMCGESHLPSFSSLPFLLCGPFPVAALRVPHWTIDQSNLSWWKTLLGQHLRHSICTCYLDFLAVSFLKTCSILFKISAVLVAHSAVLRCRPDLCVKYMLSLSV